MSCVCEASPQGPASLRCQAPKTLCHQGVACAGAATCVAVLEGGCFKACSCQDGAYSCPDTCTTCPAAGSIEAGEPCPELLEGLPCFTGGEGSCTCSGGVWSSCSF